MYFLRRVAQKPVLGLILLLAGQLVVLSSPAEAAIPPPGPKNGSVSLEGQIPSDPPKVGATITVPSNGQVFTDVPITVSGICPRGLLVQLYKNGVFSGAVQCDTGSYSLQIDLFVGRNDLVAKVFDALNQAGPDSNTVTVTFNSGSPGSSPRISLTTSFAKRGADPGSTLNWPITVTGGTPPYAISVDWGDQSDPDLISKSSAGTFNLEHIYEQPGVYNVTIKATDSRGEAAFLQLVGVGNGLIAPTGAPGATQTIRSERVIIWWPFLVLFTLALSTFWLGKKHQVEIIRTRLQRGDRPIK